MLACQRVVFALFDFKPPDTKHQSSAVPIEERRSSFFNLRFVTLPEELNSLNLSQRSLPGLREQLAQSSLRNQE